MATKQRTPGVDLATIVAALRAHNAQRAGDTIDADDVAALERAIVRERRRHGLNDDESSNDDARAEG